MTDQGFFCGSDKPLALNCSFQRTRSCARLRQFRRSYSFDSQFEIGICYQGSCTSRATAAAPDLLHEMMMEILHVWW